MTRSINDLLKSKAHALDASFPISNAFISLDERQLKYLALDTGTWFTSDIALISARLMSEFSPADTTVKLDTTEEGIKSAPIWQEGSTSFVDSMPPILIGPFGSTISPMMIAAIAEESETPQQSAQPLIKGLHSFTSFVGMDVFGTDGDLGKVTDILFEDAGLRLTHLVIENATEAVGDERIIPLEKLRYMADQDTHLVLDLTTDAVANAPRLNRADTLERDRLNALQQYYGLPMI